MKQLCLQADVAYVGVRIDKYLAEVMSDYSRSFLQKQLKQEQLTNLYRFIKSGASIEDVMELAG